MDWTTDLPTRPGRYRVRWRPSDEERIEDLYWGQNSKKAVHLGLPRNSTLRVRSCRLTVEDFELKGKRCGDPPYQWYGPIEPAE